MKKILILILLFVGFFLVLNFGRFFGNKVETAKISQFKKITKIMQKINDDEAKKHEIEEGKTALDLLQQSSEVKTKGEKENAYVIEINGKKADDAKKEFWSLYINGTIAPVGAGSYVLKNGDSIEWKIETY